jgi:outer membrane protein assembly factor BamB
MEKLMKTTKSLFGILTIICLVLTSAGCGKKQEEKSQIEQMPPNVAAPPPAQEVKATEATETTPVNQNENIILMDPATGNPDMNLTLEKINERILTGELSPTNTYRYIDNVDEPTDVQKPLSSLKGLVKFVKFNSSISPANVGVYILRKQGSSQFDTEEEKTNAEKNCFVVVGTINSSIYRDLAALSSGSFTTNNFGDALWRFVIPSTGDGQRPNERQSEPELHTFLGAKLVIVGVHSGWQPDRAIATNDATGTIEFARQERTDPRIIALNLETGKEAWAKTFSPEQKSKTVFRFIEPNYVIVQELATDFECFQGFDVLTGTQLPWTVKWNAVGRDYIDNADFIGGADNHAYLFRVNPPAICSLNLIDGSTQTVITLPTGAKEFSGTALDEKGYYQCFLLKPRDGSPAIALERDDTGFQLYSLPEGKLLWEKTHKEIYQNYPQIMERVYSSGMTVEVKCEMQGTNILVDVGAFKALLSYKTGDTISVTFRNN